jgi:hypothetical protein
LHDDAGKQRANLTADKTDAPFALFDAEHNQVFSVGPANGEGGPMRLTIGQEEKAHAALGAIDSDGSYSPFTTRTANSGLVRVRTPSRDLGCSTPTMNRYSP